MQRFANFFLKFAEIEPNTAKHHIFTKSSFSMVTEQVKQVLQQTQKKQVILFGIEAHVCVLQTAIDLIDQDFQVHIATDGTSSQRVFDRSVAFERLKQAGCYLSTCESLLFQLMGDANYEHFKQVSALCNPKLNARPEQGFFYESSKQ